MADPAKLASELGLAPDAVGAGAGAEGGGFHQGSDTAVPFVADAPLSEAQKGKLVAFRDAVKDALPDLHAVDAEYWGSEHFFLRVLAARGWNVEKASAMYKSIVAFRKERQLWRHTTEPATFYREPEVLRRYFPWGFVGLDKEGFPVLVERTGNVDLVGMHAAVGTEEFLSWVCWYHEEQERMMRRASAAVGKNRHKMTCIIDMQGIGLKHLTSATLSVLHKRTRLEEVRQAGWRGAPEKGVARRRLCVGVPCP
jgi:hypothetical protein